MLRKFLFISLMCIGVMAILVPQVDAGCCCNPQFCASWLGKCLDSVHSALVKNYPADCEPYVDCPETVASAYGVLDPDSLAESSSIASFNPDNPPTNLLIPGFVLCNTPADNPDKKFPKIGNNANPDPFYSLYGTSGLEVFQCSRNGRCKTTLTISFEGLQCKHEKWIPVDFWAEDFIGVQDMCPGGPDNSSLEKCCATNDRLASGLCGTGTENLNDGIINEGAEAVQGGPTRYVKRCYKDLTGFTPGETFTYCCAYCEPNYTEGVFNGTYDCPTRAEILTLQAQNQCID